MKKNRAMDMAIEIGNGMVYEDDCKVRQALYRVLEGLLTKYKDMKVKEVKEKLLNICQDDWVQNIDTIRYNY